MKKTCRKFLALLGCLAIIASTFVMPAAAESENIVIMCTEQLSSQTDSAWTNAKNHYEWYPGDMGLLIRKADWDGKHIVTSFSAAVPESGWYDVEFILAAWSTTREVSINATTYSKLDYWIDDDEPKPFADAKLDPKKSTIKTLSKTPLGGGNVHADDQSEQYTKTKLLDPVYLEKGNHTFNFQSTSLNVTDSALKASYHSITLTPVKGKTIVMCTEQLSSQTDSAWTNTGNHYEWYPYDMGLLIRKADWNNEPISASFSATVPETGWYDVEFILAAWSTTEEVSIMATTYSQVEYWIDNDEPKLLADAKLNPGAATVETLSKTPLGGGEVHATDQSEQYTKTKLLKPVYLEKGDHTFNFRNISLNKGGTALKASYHSITLIPFDASGIDNQTLHGGDYSKLITIAEDGTLGNYASPTKVNTVNNGKYIHLAMEADSSNAGGYKVDIPFNVYESGEYQINLEMATMGRDARTSSDEWNSPVKLKVDDGEYFRVKTFAAADDLDVTATVVNDNLQEKYDTGTDTINTRMADYQLEPMYLTEGEHIFSIWVYAPRELSATHFIFELGDIGITRITDFSTFNNITIHGGNYPCFEMKTESGEVKYVTGATYLNVAGDGTMVSLQARPSTSGAVDGYRVNIPFTVYDDGAYDIDLDMFAYSMYHSEDIYKWASKPMVKIDNGDYFWLKAFATADDPNITATVLDLDLTDKYNYDEGSADEKLWAEYALNPVELTAGDHILTICIPEQAPNQKDDIHILGIGEINIKPATADTTVVIEGEDLVIEDLTNAVADDKYNNGKYMQITNGYVVKKFYIPESGSYKVQTIATDNVSYIIDGNSVNFGEPVDLSGILAAGWNKYSSETITLEKGTHTLMLETAGAYNLDYIKISQPAALTDIDVFDIGILWVNDIAELVVVNQEGTPVSIYDVDNICYESSNEDAVEVDAYGKLKAVGMGKATVTVGVLAGGETITASTDVIVVGDSNLYVAGTAINGNDVSVTLASAGASPASEVVVGVYSVENGITKLTDVRTIDFANLSANGDDTKTVTMSAIGDDDKVMVFVFDGMDTLNPLWIKTIAK